MKSYLDIEKWNRKEIYEHFRSLNDPTFATVVNIDVTNVYSICKIKQKSFFTTYLHECTKALNSVENFKYRIEENKITIYEKLDASATILREDKTFGFSFIEFDNNYEIFHNNFLKEKERILNSVDLFPLKYSLGCFHCSALPWFSFTSHKEPVSGNKNDSVPQLSFGKIFKENKKWLMPVAVNVNHALVDGYHVGKFFENFQKGLDKID